MRPIGRAIPTWPMKRAKAMPATRAKPMMAYISRSLASAVSWISFA